MMTERLKLSELSTTRSPFGMDASWIADARATQPSRGKPPERPESLLRRAMSLDPSTNDAFTAVEVGSRGRKEEREESGGEGEGGGGGEGGGRGASGP